MSFGHKEKLLVPKVVAVEGATEVSDLENDSVLLHICRELDVINA
jgi:hypothetical protein